MKLGTFLSASPVEAPVLNVAPKQRLPGIDLFRGLAAFAVVFIHSTVVGAAPEVRYLGFLFHFAVPFFLAASFYLTCKGQYASVNFSYKARATRLLIPYLFWSVVYLSARLAKYIFLNEGNQLQELFRDPLSLIFLGGTSTQLYYIPLLMMGNLVLLLMATVLPRKINPAWLILLFLVSIGLYEAIIVTGNSIDLRPGSVASSIPLFGVLFSNVSWAIQCLPYILLALLLTHHQIEPHLEKLNKTLPILPLLLFVGVEVFGPGLLPDALRVVASGYLALLAGIALSVWLPSSRILASVGVCSYGIYLSHPLVLEVVQFCANRIPSSITAHTSLYFASVVSISTFFLSWALVAFGRRSKTFARLMFGS